jgi:hypothetical protein
VGDVANKCQDFFREIQKSAWNNPHREFETGSM